MMTPSNVYCHLKCTCCLLLCLYKELAVENTKELGHKKFTAHKEQNWSGHSPGIWEAEILQLVRKVWGLIL